MNGCYLTAGSNCRRKARRGSILKRIKLRAGPHHNSWVANCHYSFEPSGSARESEVLSEGARCEFENGKVDHPRASMQNLALYHPACCLA